jgi:hypothetical protein
LYEKRAHKQHLVSENYCVQTVLIEIISNARQMETQNHIYIILVVDTFSLLYITKKAILESKKSYTMFSIINKLPN